MEFELAFEAEELGAIVSHVRALDMDDLQEIRKATETARNRMPEGHWMIGALGVTLASIDALVEYRRKLDEIAAIVMPPEVGLGL